MSITPEETLRDLKSSRRKRAIIDGDMAAEIDDQYAFAYCMGSDKIDLLSASVSAFYEPPKNVDTEAVMLRGYEEARLVLRECGISEDETPVFKGAVSQITANPNYAPSDSPAARNIIRAALSSDEPLYVIVTGPCTNVVSACLIEPKIMDRICVVWVGGQCVPLREGLGFHEWNLFADYKAGQMLMDMDVALVLIPCDPVGSVMIKMDSDDFRRIEGSSRGAEFFRRTLPLRETTEERLNSGWRKTQCDLAGPAVLAVPDALNLQIITAPVITDDQRYEVSAERRRILYSENPDSRLIVDDALFSINSLVNR